MSGAVSAEREDSQNPPKLPMQIYIAKSGRESGPFAEDQVRSMFESNMLEASDAVWHEGLTEWVPIHRFLNVRPPVPGSLPYPVSAAQVKPVAKSGDLAPLGQRFGAALVDLTICGLATLIIAGIGMWLMGFIAAPLSDSSSIAAYTLAATVTWVGAFVLGLGPSWYYHAHFESSRDQATPGKQLFGLVVTDLHAQRIPFRQASRRAGIRVLTYVLWGLLFIVCAFSDRKRGLHDLAARTQVLKK